jgi:hypothetical protein
VRHAAQRVRVAAGVGHAVLDLLQGRVGRRGEDLPDPREPDGARQYREAEVEHHHAAVGPEHEVGRGAVAVHDRRVVRGRRRRRGLRPR